MTKKITWTQIDEAPALASYSLLPVVNSFLKAAGVQIETSDISLAARVIATFPENLKPEQRIPNHLAELGELVQKPEANIIKLPNISASLPQLLACIKELQSKGYNLPEYPVEPKNKEEEELHARYATTMGSAVNPVLREGNSDRRAAKSVKEYAMKNPHKMRAWPENSKTRIAHMDSDDFYGNEQSVVTDKGVGFKIELVKDNGDKLTLKDGLKSVDGEVLDGTFMNVNALRSFYEREIENAKKDDVLLSLHVKATMMKVSDPVLFGHAVNIFYKDLFDKHADAFREAGVNQNNGIGDLYDKMDRFSADKQEEIKKDIAAIYEKRPDLAMVDSDKGITNLHLPNNIIIDASMPVVMRDSGQMWNKDGKLQDTIAMIPDRCYATFYQTMTEDIQKNGNYDPSKIGNVSNVGLMAQKAEEYGSHPTTFIVPAAGTVQVVDDNDNVLMKHNVSEGDIWRMSRAKDIPIQDWVKLAVNRAKATGAPAVFWLDANRAHDAQIINKVEKYLPNHDTNGLEIKILSPSEAMSYTLERFRRGEDTISVTGNVLRDYLTDLFPIIELASSSKMLSIVPLLAGGGLFETGAGGSAPKHVQQFEKEGHLRWDSLGEFLALGASLDHLGDIDNNDTAKLLAKTLDEATAQYLNNRNAPSRKAGEIDNRGTHVYLAMYWAQALAGQDQDTKLKEKFAGVAKEIEANKDKILAEIDATQNQAMDNGGYYHPDFEKVNKNMRPSSTLNAIIDAV